MAFTTFMYSLTLPKTMFAIQPLGHGNADKKLGPSVLGPAFAMDEMTGPICFRRKFFSHHQIFPVDGLAVSVIRVWEVTTLAHKLQNNAMKESPFLLSPQRTKAFCCLWNSVFKELKGNAVQGLTVDIRKNIVGLSKIKLTTQQFCF